MTKYVKQFRYYGDGHPSTYPDNLTASLLATGNIFLDYNPISSLGIQAEPGTKFYINGSSNPIIVGSTGIYELDLEKGFGHIYSIKFDNSSLAEIGRYVSGVSSLGDNGLIIDILYEDEIEE